MRITAHRNILSYEFSSDEVKKILAQHVLTQFGGEPENLHVNFRVSEMDIRGAQKLESARVSIMEK